jgi:hypothetical protein
MHSYRTILMSLLTLVLLPGLTTGVWAQSMQTEHVFKLDDPLSRPPATLNDVSWLVGSWTGDAFGSTFEEVWNSPSAGSMVGMWKLKNDDEVVFYELMLIVEEEGSLSLKVKHFTDDFVAWEVKEDFVRFRLVSFDENAVHFSGLSFHRISGDEIHGFIAMHSNGEVREEKLIYHRAD